MDRGVAEGRGRDQNKTPVAFAANTALPKPTLRAEPSQAWASSDRSTCSCKQRIAPQAESASYSNDDSDDDYYYDDWENMEDDGEALDAYLRQLPPSPWSVRTTCRATREGA
jgi:hypothetical protein